MIQNSDEQQKSNNEKEADKIFITEDSTLQNQEEATAKDNYYEVDEKKLVVTNIGDGTPHDEGLATNDKNDDDENLRQ